jgi:hypothetical protein
VGSGYAGIAEFMIVTVLVRIFPPKSSRSWNGFFGVAIIRFLAGWKSIAELAAGG